MQYPPAFCLYFLWTTKWHGTTFMKWPSNNVVYWFYQRTNILLQRCERQAMWPSLYLDAFGEEVTETWLYSLFFYALSLVDMDSWECIHMSWGRGSVTCLKLLVRVVPTCYVIPSVVHQNMILNFGITGDPLVNYHDRANCDLKYWHYRTLS